MGSRGWAVVMGSFLTASCAEPAPEPIAGSQQPVLGGTPQPAGAYPTVAAIHVQGVGDCTGTLVTPTLVLTAAHCIDPAVAGFPDQTAVTANTFVGFDVVDVLGAWPTVLPAADTLPHPDFDIADVGAGHDVGFITLPQAILDRVPSPVNRDAAAAAPGVSVTIAGYGVYQLPFDAGVLHAIEDEPTMACGALPDATFLCFDLSDGSGTCSGDSGAASFLDDAGTLVVAGVTSFGDAACTSFAAHVRTDAELPFLDAAMCVIDGYCVEGCTPVDADCTGGGGGGAAGAAGSGGGGPGTGATGGGDGVGGLGDGAEAGTPSDANPSDLDTDDGGCGCSVPRREQVAGLWLIALLLPLLARRKG